MFVKIRNRFFTGIAVIFPLAITFFIIKFIVDKINSWILNPFIKLLSPFLNSLHAIFIVKVVIFVLAIAFICIVGWAANVLVLRRFFGNWEKLLLKVPMLGRIYNAVKQISSAFLGEGKTIFSRVVLIEYPRKGLYSIGFVTKEATGEVQSETKETVVNVFIPTTPNPTSGVFLLVPRGELKVLKMSVEDAMKMVVSGGAVAPPIEYKE